MTNKTIVEIRLHGEVIFTKEVDETIDYDDISVTLEWKLSNSVLNNLPGINKDSNQTKA